MTKNSGGIVIESYSHRFKEGGYEVTIVRAGKRRKLGGPVITLQGGLTDNLSKSMGAHEKKLKKGEGLAHALIEASGGELVVASVATIRPENILQRVSGSFHSKTHRSKANAGAAKYMNDLFKPDTLAMAGQSLGGVSAIHGALWHAHPTPHGRKPSPVKVDGVVTIDSPGMFGPLEYEGTIVDGLRALVGNCINDMKHLDRFERARQLAPLVLNLAGPLEAAFVLNEISFSHEGDFSGEVAELRGYGVDVSHVFHAEDCIPGAEVDSPHSQVFPGGHLRFMYEPEPVAEHIVDFVDYLANKPTIVTA